MADKTASIRYVEDKNGDIFFPVTHQRGVVDSDGNNLETALAGKQDTLVSGTSIKTINGSSILGSGNIEVQTSITTDSTPTSGSTNPVESGGVYTALQGKQTSISTVNVSVDSNTGTPSATASVTGDTMSISFSNLKGGKGDTGATPEFSIGTVSTLPEGSQATVSITGTTDSPILNIGIPTGATGAQGNTGSSVDYPYELVNNVTTNDATKGLSAAQGKVLDDKISQLGLKVDGELRRYKEVPVDLSTLDITNFGVSGTVYTTGEHVLVDISDVEMVAISGNAVNGSSIYIMRGLYGPYNNGTIGTGLLIKQLNLSAGEYTLERIPSDALCLIVNKTINSNNVLPQSITLYKSSKEDINDEIINGEKPRTFEVDRFYVTGGALAYAAANRNANGLIKVAKGKTYDVEITASATPEMYFISGLPRIGEAATRVQTLSAATSFLITYTATADGFLFFRVFGTSSPTITITSANLQNDNSLRAITADNSVIIKEFAENDIILHRINPYGYERMAYDILKTSGAYGGSSGNYHYLFPVRSGQLARIVANSSQDALIAWLSGADTPAANAMPPYLSGTGPIIIPQTMEKLLLVPDGAKYMYVSWGTLSGPNWPDYVGLSVDFHSVPDIVRLNDYLKSEAIFKQFSLTTRSEQDENASTYLRKPFIFLHFSDIHGGTAPLRRLNDYRKFFGKYIEATLQTGDLLSTQYTNDNPFGEAAADNPNNDILSVIGNHDTATYVGGVYTWHEHQGVDVYNKIFAPYISHWQVTQPTDAAVQGLCYYYKDYLDSKIRLICLDTWYDGEDYHEAQRTWFANVLNSARESGLSVIVATHARIKAERTLNTTFSRIDAEVANPALSYTNDSYIPLVTSFKQNGGDFICWLSGHSHYDAVTITSEATGSLLNIAVGNANRAENNSSSDLFIGNSMIGIDQDDFRTFDLFNVMAIDVIYKTISLLRVGSPFDKLGRHIETSCINYATGQLIF